MTKKPVKPVFEKSLEQVRECIAMRIFIEDMKCFIHSQEQISAAARFSYQIADRFVSVARGMRDIPVGSVIFEG